jgi:hypothetical protein
VHVVEAKSHDRAKRFEHRIYVGETKPRLRDPNAPLPPKDAHEKAARSPDSASRRDVYSRSEK